MEVETVDPRYRITWSERHSEIVWMVSPLIFEVEFVVRTKADGQRVGQSGGMENRSFLFLFFYGAILKSILYFTLCIGWYCPCFVSGSDCTQEQYRTDALRIEYCYRVTKVWWLVFFFFFQGPSGERGEPGAIGPPGFQVFWHSCRPDVENWGSNSWEGVCLFRTVIWSSTPYTFHLNQRNLSILILEEHFFFGQKEQAV